ncbi:MAG: SEC-C domain-containing protein [Betaproteobacteria bacterium]|nr:SEC-C domain-containing protein [Betaproteobacteria bacterium]
MAEGRRRQRRHDPGSHRRGRGRLVAGARGLRGRRGDALVRAQPDAADARSPLARPPGEPRSPAAGHTPARVRAEEPEAGVQARGVRAVLGDARPGQAGRREGRADRAGPQPAGRRRGRGARGRQQRSLPARRLRGGARVAPAGDDAAKAVEAQPFVRSGDKVGRNDPCPCGSGKKYKQCHGRLA